MNKSIENLKKLKSFHNGSYGADIDKAIKALEQEPCEDAVSRRFMYELGATCIATRDKNGKLIALGAIENLPSVIPKGVTITDFADKCRECGREKVLDKIRAEIEYEHNRLRPLRADEILELGECLALRMALQIIDKYKKSKESE